MSLTVHIVTAVLRQGDAIGNYILSLARLLRGWGAGVHLYADHLDTGYPLHYRHTGEYRPTGRDILWLHYSIAAPSAGLLAQSPDLRLLDYHGVCPPRLFHGYDARMEELCAQGEAGLPALARHADVAVAHSAYARDELLGHGFRRVRTLPLIVDTARFSGAGDPDWEPLLSGLDYLLFVGRVVPQKGLARSLGVFAALRERRPGLKYLIVGGRSLPRYAEELERRAAELGVAEDVIFAGAIPEARTLTSLYRHARFYLALSEWESFCVPLAEALHFGAPVLGWAVPPIPETMGPGGVILSGSPAEMAAQADALWADGARYAELQAAGRAHAERFTDVALRRELLALLGELAERI